MSWNSWCETTSDSMSTFLQILCEGLYSDILWHALKSVAVWKSRRSMRGVMQPLVESWSRLHPRSLNRRRTQARLALKYQVASSLQQPTMVKATDDRRDIAAPELGLMLHSSSGTRRQSATVTSFHSASLAQWLDLLYGILPSVGLLQVQPQSVCRLLHCTLRGWRPFELTHTHSCAWEDPFLHLNRS